MKRGEKLNLENAKEEADLVDGGLRYDLRCTAGPVSIPIMPVSCPRPSRALQMGNVWRADRPQRGRYRQFMQCDT